MSVLKITGLSLNAGQQQLVHDLHLSIEKQQWLALIGESGSGKTLTGLAIAGLLPQAVRMTNGEILVKGQSLSELSAQQINGLRGKEIAYVFQDYAGMFSPFIRLGKQLDETLQAHRGLGRKERKKQILTCLEEVRLPAERIFKSYPCELSGGQLQRVTIAAAMLLQPKLLIADEPTTALDQATGEEILGLLKEMQERIGCAILFITHDLRHVRRYADQVAIMRGGCVLESGDVRSVLEQPAHFYTKQLLAAESALLSSPTRTLEQEARLQLVDADQTMLDQGTGPASTRGNAMLSAQNLVKTYPQGIKALDQVSFTLKAGECLGLVGESGSGKSTMARCLMLMEPLDEGELLFQQMPLHKRKAAARSFINGRIQTVFQNPAASLNPRLTIVNSLMEPLDVFKDKTPAFLGDSRYKRDEAAALLLDMVGLPASVMRQYPHELSGGQKQRVCIARAISIAPDFIILDEPTASLDMIIQAQILKLLQRLQQQLGFACLFISHDLAAVQFMCSRMMVLERGKITIEDARFPASTIGKYRSILGLH
ncbi:ABC transporter ATP-binding protein [Paenibacillus algorifonticola]|uniref:nickel ABC transporter ATP-binding protein NikE n=1 Tax=Paenibacillus algorifonticola TaxID=684063 RepID=UPI003D26E152